MSSTQVIISGYQVAESIYESQKTLVYRALRSRDRLPVILKTLRSEYPAIVDIARLKHEYEITKNLDIPGIVQPYNLKTYRHSPLLILEDFGGQALSDLIPTNSLTLAQCLQIAIQLATTLGQLHQKQIIHKDIKPQNLIINTETEQVKIGDFSIASQLSKENPNLNSPNLIEGTLAYMSPEQTGRMNRVLDYRTDFYSLGVSLYEILTGKLPFSATDAMELVHCHIAKQQCV
ncbi:MAG: serine/threonine-protein kinase [Oscillatoria sp. PMC 1068.18]|nr:serine/threonine-protein kinase [Oscillatoria sp. PMC 1076.18]MEC4988900.1 serine/threonine-protein kinase [Oscillatoria sp. PMC 1068.18]